MSMKKVWVLDIGHKLCKLYLIWNKLVVVVVVKNNNNNQNIKQMLTFNFFNNKWSIGKLYQTLQSAQCSIQDRDTLKKVQK